MTHKAPTYKPNSRDYLPRSKRTFKERVKNFFNADIEKDLQEEESTKVFKRIKLFTLNRSNLFISLALFMIIINFLVGFNLNFLYLRQILGFLFLILVPGLLIMLCFKVRVKFWEYLVYTIGLSVAFIMFAGLAVNWTLPLLHITDKPLSLYPILICFNIFLMVLGIVAWKRNKDLEHEFTTPKLDKLNNIFFIIPMLFPVLSVLGAFILNNHGPNILTMIMLGGIAVYVLLLVVFRKRLNENIWPWALYWIGLALLLMYSMRSWYISGWDINQEYNVFTTTKLNFSWKFINVMGSYNSLLSISIFPDVLDILMRINSFLIFKLLFQVIFSLLLVIIFCTYKKFSSLKFAFIGVFFFCSQILFFSFSSWCRQEIAFIFFGLMILVLFTKQISPILKKALFVIFGVSMIVSHYSTSYIALVIFTLTYVITLFYKKHEDRKIKKGELHSSQKSEFCLTGVLILLLLLFGFLWYSQVTTTANDLIDFVGKSISNLGNMFNEDVSSEHSSLFYQFNIFSTTSNMNPLLQNFSKDIKNEYSNRKVDFFSSNTYEDYNIHSVISKSIQQRFSLIFAKTIYLFYEVVKKLFKLFIILGVIYLFITLFKAGEKNINKLFIILNLSMLILVILAIIVPLASINYGLARPYQQTLLILSLSMIFGFLLILSWKFNKYKLILIYFFVIIYFLLTSGFFTQIVGSYDASFNLNNFGSYFDGTYMQSSDFNSIKWISGIGGLSRIYTDSTAEYKFYAFSRKKFIIYREVLPQVIDKKEYVFSSYINTINNIGFLDSNLYFKRETVGYNFPTEFLNDNKNKIYNNGGSEIFK